MRPRFLIPFCFFGGREGAGGYSDFNVVGCYILFFFFGGMEREREKQERGKYKDLIDFLQNRKVNGCHFFFFFEREKSTVQNPKGAWVPFFFFQFLVRGRTQRMKNIYIIIYNIIYIYIYRYIYIYFFTDPS